MSAPEDSSGALNMASCLLSTKRALADLTWDSSCMSRFRSHAPGAAGSAPIALAATSAAAQSAAPSSAPGLPPEIIEIEPVVRRAPAIVLEPPGIALQQRLDHRLARGAGELFHARQALEVDLVAVAPAVEAEHERDRALQHRGDADRAGRELGVVAEEAAGHRAAALDRAVREQAHDLPARQRGLDLQYRVHLAEPDDLRFQLGRDALEDFAGFPGVLLVHHHVDLEPPRPAGGAHDLETADVGAEQHAALPRREHFRDELGAVHADFEPVDLAPEEVEPVERDRREHVVVTEGVREAGLAPQRAAQIIARGRARAG